MTIKKNIPYPSLLKAVHVIIKQDLVLRQVFFWIILTFLIFNFIIYNTEYSQGKDTVQRILALGISLASLL